MMTIQGRRDESARPDWFSAAFWVTVGLAVYLILLVPDRWVWLLLTVAGVALSYGWWMRHRRGKFWLLFVSTCAFFALLALFGAGRAVLATASVPADSVGQWEVVCGSVVNPVAGEKLQVTAVESGELVVESRPIPQASWREFARTSFAIEWVMPQG